MYAEDGVGAICTTGNGEAITRTVLAYRIFAKMQQGSLNLEIFLNVQSQKPRTLKLESNILVLNC